MPLPADTSSPSARPTSYDVARLAGVSQSAVSRCFKPGASISPDMRARVETAAAQLGYLPNAMARGLITNRSGLVAVLVSSGLNVYYPEALIQLTEHLGARSLRVLLFTVDDEAEAGAAIAQMRQYGVDGVISAAHLSRDHHAELARRGLPVVMFNRWFDRVETDTVWCDGKRAVEELVDGLVAGGHRRVALITAPDSSMVGRFRMEHVRSALASHGLATVAEVRGDYGYDCAAEAVEALLPAKPTAVIAANDMMALGAVDALRARDLRVPEDVSVAGFDGIRTARLAAYDLATVRQPIGRMAEAAVEMLGARIEADTPDTSFHSRTLDGALVPGGSTAPVSESTP